MKTLKFVFLSIAAAVVWANAQSYGTPVALAGRPLFIDTVRWGDSDDSTGYMLIRRTSKFRDSSGSWRAYSSDSCSKAVKIGASTLSNQKLEMSYDVRTSSGNTDSSQIKLRADTRYCRGMTDTTRCEPWVSAGRFRGDTSSTVIDSLVTIATTSGTTWKPTRQVFDVPGGDQIRFCVDGYKTGGATGDSTFFRRFVLRTSGIPAGGIPPGAAGGGAGDASASNQTSGAQKTQIVDGSGNVIGATSNALDVNIKSGAGSGGTAMTDDAAFTPATTSVTPIAGFADETGPDAVDEGDAGAVRMTLQRGLHVNLRNASGTELGVSAAPVRTDPTGTTAQPVTDNGSSLTVDYATTGSGTATGAIRVELPTNGTGVIATVGAVTSVTNTVTVGGTAAADAAVSGNPVYTAGRASAAAPADVSADGDVVPAWRLRNGAAATVITAAGALVGGDATNGLDVDVTRINDGGNSITVDNAGTFAVQAGQVSDGSAASGNPVTVGAVARSTDPTAESSGDGVSLMTTTTKKLVTMPYALPGERWTYAAASGGIVNTTGVTIKAAVAGQKNCIKSVDIVNGHATVSTEVVLRDGASGTVLKRWWAQAAGGGLARPVDPPVCGTTNTLLEVAAITTGAAVYFNAEGYEGDE